jgi:hypothetical protein
MVLTLNTVALPDAGTTCATLSAGMAHALHERDTAARTSAPMAAICNLDAAALHKHREPVTLAAYDLGDPEAKIDVERKGNRDVPRRQGGKRNLVGLFETISKKRKGKEKKEKTYINAEVLHQATAGLLASGQRNEAATARDSHVEPPKGRQHGGGVALGSHAAGASAGAGAALLLLYNGQRPKTE